MNKFKRDMNKYIGESPRFNEPLKLKILSKIRGGNKSRESARKDFITFKYAAIFMILLAFVTSFLIITLNENGQETQAPSTAQSEKPTLNFSDESDNWKVTYIFNDLGDNVRETFGTIEYIGGNSKPEEVTFRFIYRNGEESFGGSLILEEDGSYVDIDNGTCKKCIMLNEDDEISGVIEWEGQKERLVLTNQ